MCLVLNSDFNGSSWTYKFVIAKKVSFCPMSRRTQRKKRPGLEKNVHAKIVFHELETCEIFEDKVK